jgi:cell division transport system permease protein
MVMTIFLITSLFLLGGITKFLITSLQEKVDISVYFKTDAQESDILELKADLEKVPAVKAVEYISKDEALAQFKERHKSDNVILQALEEIGDNPLLAALQIQANQASQYEAITNFLEASFSYQDIIEKINYRETKAIIDRIFSISASINTTGFIFSLILGFIAVLVAFNTVRMAIYSLREEIAIMRLVGASNWFIRGPFIVQGAIAGGIAALISFLLFLILMFFLSPNMQNLLPGFNLLGYFLSNLGTIILIQILTGVGLGIISSFIAIRRYLNI